MNVLVVGYGSIGRRHCRLLQELGCTVAVVSRQEDVPFPCYASLEEALRFAEPDYVVVANRTHEHYPTLAHLRTLGYQGAILMEKPLFDSALLLQPSYLQSVFTAYNLRFHPVLQRLKRLLKPPVISVQVYAGQYLPDWRDSDYRTSYSAYRSQGGGVLRDLSHELDYIQWLFGPWTGVCAIGGRHSPLEIESEDVFALLLRTSGCPVVSVQMNYLDRIRQRHVIVNTADQTYLADLIRHTLQIGRHTEAFLCDADTTYRSQHQAMLLGRHEQLCSGREALQTLQLIEQAERSARLGRWIIG
ncbi:Gfo/Idh/MocA family protein [Paenibacillus sp. y28]|uniref:Gfo/Idh/MocA family protein n=1 Tax=Paenibacillus sp. y28 TaxID=3129110 RepID=UPI00301739AE